MPPPADTAPTRFVREHLSRIAPGQPVPWPAGAIIIAVATVPAAVAAAIAELLGGPSLIGVSVMAYAPACILLIWFHSLRVRHRGWALLAAAVAVGAMAVLSSVVPADWAIVVKSGAILVGLVAYIATTHLPDRAKPVAPAVSWNAETGGYTPDRRPPA
jgi:hypothetical protein